MGLVEEASYYIERLHDHLRKNNAELIRKTLMSMQYFGIYRFDGNFCGTEAKFYQYDWTPLEELLLEAVQNNFFDCFKVMITSEYFMDLAHYGLRTVFKKIATHFCENQQNAKQYLLLIDDICSSVVKSKMYKVFCLHNLENLYFFNSIDLSKIRDEAKRTKADAFIQFCTNKSLTYFNTHIEVIMPKLDSSFFDMHVNIGSEDDFDLVFRNVITNYKTKNWYIFALNFIMKVGFEQIKNEELKTKCLLSAPISVSIDYMHLSENFKVKYMAHKYIIDNNLDKYNFMYLRFTDPLYYLHKSIDCSKNEYLYFYNLSMNMFTNDSYMEYDQNLVKILSIVSPFFKLNDDGTICIKEYKYWLLMNSVYTPSRPLQVHYMDEAYIKLFYPHDTQSMLNLLAYKTCAPEWRTFVFFATELNFVRPVHSMFSYDLIKRALDYVLNYMPISYWTCRFLDVNEDLTKEECCKTVNYFLLLLSNANNIDEYHVKTYLKIFDKVSIIQHSLFVEILPTEFIGRIYSKIKPFMYKLTENAIEKIKSCTSYKRMLEKEQENDVINIGNFF